MRMRTETVLERKNRVVQERNVELENGYVISIRREKIPRVGRSIFREIASEQFVLEIVDRSGQVTKRLPFPENARAEIVDFLTT